MNFKYEVGDVVRMVAPFSNYATIEIIADRKHENGINEYSIKGMKEEYQYENCIDHKVSDAKWRKEAYDELRTYLKTIKSPSKTTTPKIEWDNTNGQYSILIKTKIRQRKNV